MKRLLILGGTTEATALAAQAQKMIPHLDVITSLAGRTQSPIMPTGSVRVGGFGGSVGLADYLRDQHISLLIDATHPFAAQISWNAATAATDVGIPYLMLVRPAWQPGSGDRWIEVESHQAAANLLPGLAQRIFLTIGRQELVTYAHLQDLWFLMRTIDPPDPSAAVPKGLVLIDRGPFMVESEKEVLTHYRIEAIVTKNSGGHATVAKLIAARELTIPVVMIERPSIPTVEVVSTVEQVLTWLTNQV